MSDQTSQLGLMNDAFLPKTTRVIVPIPGPTGPAGRKGDTGARGPQGIQGPPGASGSGSSYYTTFTNSNLSSGNLSVSHSLDEDAALVVIVNNSNQQVIPDNVTYSDDNNIVVDLSSFAPLTGTWRIRILA